jgi:hypothetical protein
MKKQTIDSEYTPFVRGTMITSDPQTMSLADVVQAFVVLKDTLEGLAKVRHAELRTYLLNYAEKLGEATDKGGQRLSVDGSTVTREKRVTKTLDVDAVLNLAAEKGLKPEDVCDEVTTKALVPNPSLLNLLVQKGALTKAEVDALYPVTWALKVVGSEELVGALCEAAGGIKAVTEALPPEPKSPKPKSKKSK